MPSIADAVTRDRVLSMARDLIRIPSFTGDELTIMRWVQDWAASNELNATTIARDPMRPNVVISIGDPATGPTLVMNGHLDTVPLSDRDAWRTDPFDPTVSDDGARLFGLGSSDMKSSVGVMLVMMQLFRDIQLGGCLQAHVVVDEEVGGHFGTIAVLEAVEAGTLARPTYCLIGEKSDLKVRNAERGILKLRVTVHGRASHTAAARVTGINAIALASRAVLALERDLDAYHPSVGKPVISINQISGGVAHNVVPADCAFSVDRRLIPGETLESVVAEIRSTLDRVVEDDGRFRYTLEADPDGDFIPANITEPDSTLVQAVKQASRDVRGEEPEFFVQWAGATDGRYYRQMGIETVGLGPGGEGAHGANEAVYIDDLVTQGKIYAKSIERLLGA